MYICGTYLAGDATPAGSTVVQIDGVTFTTADLDARKPTLLFQARNAFYEAQRKAVDDFVNDYLLDRQAEKEHITVAELLQRHAAVEKDPSEEALRVYYEGVETKEPYEAVRDKILDAVRQRRLARAKANYLQVLRSQANVSVRLAPPKTAISLKDTPIRGLPDAPVMIVEYADYECPYCRQMQPVLDRLSAEYGKKLAIAYKDVPLPSHANAQKAAEAAHCAGSQGKFWEYHDLLYAGTEYGLPKLKEHARALKLDTQSFDTCLDTGTPRRAGNRTTCGSAVAGPAGHPELLY